jgi:xylulokinase
MAQPAACFLGIDVRRDGLGLAVLAANGVVLGTLDRSYTGTPSDTSDPQDWWRAARTGIKELLRRVERPATSIRCIGVTGDSSSFVALDREGKVLCPSTFGPDPRAAQYVDEVVRRVGLRNLVNLAGAPATSACMAVKLCWLRDNEKRAWHDLAWVLPPKDFIRFRLTGTLATDASDAMATLLANPKSRSWSKQLLGQLDLPAQWLPAIAAGPAITGRVTADAARESGLQSGTPVVAGAAHVAAAAIAVGAIAPGSAVVELGGDGALFIPTSDAVRDPSQRLVSTCHSVAGTWALSASGLAGDPVLEWLMSQVLTAEVSQARRAKREPLDLLAELAAEVPPGSDGLLFLPPGVHPISGFIGLGWQHRRGHLVRAVLESGALALRLALDAADALKRRPTTITVTGPGARNTLWCQLAADAINQPLHALADAGGDVVGAALLASSAVGIFKNLEEACAKLVGKPVVYTPRRAATEAYTALLPELSRVADAFRPAPLPAIAETAL